MQFQLLELVAQCRQSFVALCGVTPLLAQQAQWRDHLVLPGAGQLAQLLYGARAAGYAASFQPAQTQQQADILALCLQYQAVIGDSRQGIEIQGKLPQRITHAVLPGELLNSAAL